MRKVLLLLCVEFAVCASFAEARGAEATFSQLMEPTRMAVTVDDLPGPISAGPAGTSNQDIARGLLRALKDNRVPQAYGFANGYPMDSDPRAIGVLKDWLDACYPLGNHTYSHMDLSKVTAQAYIADIERLDRVLAMLAPPVSPSIEQRRVFRYPYLDEADTLAKRDEVRGFLAKNGYRIAEVTIDYFDWAWNSAYDRCEARHDAKSIEWLREHVAESADSQLHRSRSLGRYLFGRNIPQILLLHFGAFEALTLDATLKDLRMRNVTFVTLDEALSDPAYRINSDFVSPNGMGFLTQVALARKAWIGPQPDPRYAVDRIRQICSGTPPAG